MVLRYNSTYFQIDQYAIMIIKELKLFSSQIKAQTEFYSEVLGLKKLYGSINKVSFQVGSSILHLEYKEDATPYHFAINIPANKEQEALHWLKSRLRILKDDQDEIIDFKAWNAKAIYFYDHDKNIVELIARKNLKNHSELEFSADQFLEISEIGVPTNDIEREYGTLRDVMDIRIYDGGLGNFCAIGDENGLFICINKNRKNWYPTQDKAYFSDFEVIVLQEGKSYCANYRDGAIKVQHFHQGMGSN